MVYEFHEKLYNGLYNIITPKSMKRQNG